MGMKRNVTLDSTVFVSSWGWRDCDPCGSVCATTYKRAEKLALQGMRADARYAALDCDSEYKTIRAALYNIAWYGVSSFTFRDVAPYGESALEELNDNGFCYLDIP